MDAVEEAELQHFRHESVAAATWSNEQYEIDIGWQLLQKDPKQSNGDRKE
jgi:hypothetical protein